MKRAAVLCCVVVVMFGVGAKVSALKVADPTPNKAFTDTEGNQGYIEVAGDGGAVLRACNENDASPAGDKATGYIWVNPSGEPTTATYGNSTIGAGDADGEDGSPPADVDQDTNDDCAGNNTDPPPAP